MSALVENFDGRNNGNLAGQGDWFGDNDIVVQEAVKKAGAKAIECENEAGLRCYHPVDNQAAGVQRAFQKGVGFSNSENIKFGFYESTGATFFVWIQVHEEDGVEIVGWNGDINIRIKLADYIDDHWFDCEIEWNAAANQVRGRVDGGAWSAWIDVISFAAVGWILVEAYTWLLTGGGAGYWDELGPGAPTPAGRSFGQII